MTDTPAARCPPPGRHRLGGCLLAAVAAAGCQGIQQPDDLRGQLQQQRQENARLREQVRQLREDLQGRDEHIRSLQALGEKRLDKLFHVTGIKLGRTSGVNLDGVPGDDAIRVYLRPVDRDGHPIKAAGAVTVQVYDLAVEPANSLLTECRFSLEEMAKCWSSGFMTYHYRLECPWKTAPPARAEVTVRVVFTDYLTGREFTAQKVVKVALPTTTRPKE